MKVKYERMSSRDWSYIICSSLIFVGLLILGGIHGHMYTYPAVIPCLLYGKWKNNKIFLYAGLICLLVWSFKSGPNSYIWPRFPEIHEGYKVLPAYNDAVCFILLVAVYATFLYVSHGLEFTGIKVCGYLLLSWATWHHVEGTAFWLMKDYGLVQSQSFFYIDERAVVAVFLTTAIIHLVLSNLKYFGHEGPVRIMMLVFSTVGIFTGDACIMEMTTITITSPWFLLTIFAIVLWLVSFVMDLIRMIK